MLTGLIWNSDSFLKCLLFIELIVSLISCDNLNEELMRGPEDEFLPTFYLYEDRVLTGWVADHDYDLWGWCCYGGATWWA